jgi:hypothetical protein
MIIKLSPQLGRRALVVTKAGNTLTINGELFDFSRMVEGDVLSRTAITSDWFSADVEYKGGQLIVPLILPIFNGYTQAQAFPADLVNVPDGPVVFP